MKEHLIVTRATFQKITDIFPTMHLSRSAPLRRIWQLLLKFAPPNALLFRTPHYTCYAATRPGPITHKVLRRGCYEPLETRVYCEHLKRGNVIFDIGANFGHYTLTAANLIGPTGRVFAFEPEPHHFKVLQENLTILPHPNVTALSCALGREEGTLTLYTDLDNAGGHSTAAKNVGNEGAHLTVPQRTVDALVRQYAIERVDLLKLDTQGAEAHIFEGAWKTITRDLPVIISEFCPDFIVNAGGDPRGLLEKFQGLGYKISLIDERQDHLQPLTTWDYAQWPRGTEGSFHTNILLTPPCAN